MEYFLVTNKEYEKEAHITLSQIKIQFGRDCGIENPIIEVLVDDNCPDDEALYVIEKEEYFNEV